MTACVCHMIHIPFNYKGKQLLSRPFLLLWTNFQKNEPSLEKIQHFCLEKISPWWSCRPFIFKDIDNSSTWACSESFDFKIWWLLRRQFSQDCHLLRNFFRSVNNQLYKFESKSSTSSESSIWFTYTTPDLIHSSINDPTRHNKKTQVHNTTMRRFHVIPDTYSS